MRLNEWINKKLFQSMSPRITSEMQLYRKTQQPIKLSVITQFFPPDYAATGQLVEELVTYLGQQEIDIEVFTSQPGYAFRSSNAPSVERHDRLRIQRSRTARLWPERIRGKAINGLLYTFRAGLHLLRSKYRSNLLLVTTAPPFLPVLAYLAYLFFKIPYVCIVYDLYPDIAIALGVLSKYHWVAKLWQSLNRRIWCNAKQIVVLSPNMKLQLLKYCPQIADKVCVIHSWADPNWIVPIAKHENWFAWKYNLVKKFTVLYSGNMGRCHDMDTILEAAKLLEDQPIQFVCIGSGAKREQVIKQVNQLGLNNFLFLPYQEKQVLPYSLTACDLSLVSVDASTESLVAPSKLYSALASGRPIAVICSQYSYLKELIAEASCGATFENGEGYALAQFIRLLSRDQQLVESMGKAGRQYLCSHFTLKIISQQYLDVLQRALSFKEVKSLSHRHIK